VVDVVAVPVVVAAVSAGAGATGATGLVVNFETFIILEPPLKSFK